MVEEAVVVMKLYKEVRYGETRRVNHEVSAGKTIIWKHGEITPKTDLIVPVTETFVESSYSTRGYWVKSEWHWEEASEKPQPPPEPPKQSFWSRLFGPKLPQARVVK